MKITRVSIEGIKGIEKEFSFKPADVNVAVGPNGSGKSTLENAIEAAFTGGKGKSLVTIGKDKGRIAVEVFGHKIERIFGDRNTVKMDGKTTTQKSIDAFIEENSGTKISAIKMITSGDIIDKIRSGKLAQFLLENDLVPASVDQATVMSSVAVPEDVAEKLAEFLPPMPETFGIDTLAEAAKEASAQRLALKKMYSDESGKSKFDGPVPTLSIEDIDAEIAKLTARKAVAATVARQKADYEAALKKREEHADAVKKLEGDLLKAKVPAPDAGKKSNIEKMLATIQTALSANNRNKAVLENNLKYFKEGLANLETSVCPLSEGLVCTTDKTAAKDTLKARISENESEIANIDKENKILEAKISKCQDELRKYTEALNKFQSYSNAYARYKAMKENPPALPKKPEMVEEEENADEKIAKLREMRNTVAQYALAKAAEKRAEEIKAEIKILDEVVALLSPKGAVYASIIAGMLKPLEEHCNKKAAILKPGFSIGIDMAETVFITCRASETAPFVDVADCSSGEQLLVMFLILDMINALSGFGILMLDDLDKLDEKAFAGLLTLLQNKEAISEYDHIFIAAVDHEDTMKALDTVPADWRVIEMPRA